MNNGRNVDSCGVQHTGFWRRAFGSIHSVAAVALSFFILVLPSQSHAAIVQYFLHEVDFSGGGSAQGTFAFDTDSESVIAFGIQTTGAGQFSGRTYTNANADAFYRFDFDAFNLDFVLDDASGGFNSLRLAIRSPGLVDVDLEHSLVVGIDYSEELYFSAPSSQIVRSVSSGFLSATSIPEPTSLALVMVALVGVGFKFKRRRWQS
jgi:hypothetical protein